MSENLQPEPKKILGSKLKHLREQWQQSIEEVSATLELDVETLRLIEEGQTMPGDDTLEMLINHFLLTDEQAKEVRELSLKSKGINPDSLSAGLAGLDDSMLKQIVMLLPPDNKVIYTDGMQATVNDNGVVLQYMQKSPHDGKQVPIARLGMSKDHAEKMIKVLQSTLKHHRENHGPKYLSDGN